MGKKETDSLGKRMKEYEFVTRTHLTRRMPAIIRIDGKAFHTFTRGFKKPFDDVLVKSMQDTMKYLCENIQGCVLGYTQSDEITLVLVDYKKIDSDSWFAYNVQKCSSIAASMATMVFNKSFRKRYDEWGANTFPDWYAGGTNEEVDNEALLQSQAYWRAAERGAMFDARIFNIPKEEVCNNILWRQNDATRNSIEMVGHCNFSQKELHKKNCNKIQDMLFTEKGINWNDYPTHLKRGSCCIKQPYTVKIKTGHMTDSGIQKCEPFEIHRTKWVIDENIPIFKGEGRSYIDKLIFVGE